MKRGRPTQGQEKKSPTPAMQCSKSIPQKKRADDDDDDDGIWMLMMMLDDDDDG